MSDYKQAILIRMDLGMSSGKIASQAAHASIDAVVRVQKHDSILNTGIFDKWRKQGMKKVVLKAASERELFQIKADAEREGIRAAIIKDAGLTELPPGTHTALAIGPDISRKIDKITGKLIAL